MYPIEVKKLLKNIYKRKMNIERMKYLLENIGMFSGLIFPTDYTAYVKGAIASEEVSLKDDVRELNIMLNGYKYNDMYNLIYYNILPYIAPLSFQGRIAIISDFYGGSINNVYNFNKKYEIQQLTLCVFPLKTKTVVFMYTNKRNKRYNRFVKQFNKLSFEKKLAVINYMIFLYSEDYLLSSEINQDVFTKSFKETSGLTLYQFCDSIDEMYNKETLDIFALKIYLSIPNLLSKEYALEKDLTDD